MKYLLTYIALFTSVPPACFAQKENIDTVQFNYSSVVLVDSVPGRVLQARARLFLSQNFKSAKDATIQLDDPEGGVIVVKAMIVPAVKSLILGSIGYGHVHFTLELRFKDGKFKYTFSDFFHRGDGNNIWDGGPLSNPKPKCGSFHMSEGTWRKVKEYTNVDALSFIDRLTAQIKNSSVGVKKDDF
jgi:hypothetical protein